VRRLEGEIFRRRFFYFILHTPLQLILIFEANAYITPQSFSPMEARSDKNTLLVKAAKL